MKIGNEDVSKLYLGNNEIEKVYIGTSQVYDGGDTPTPPHDYSQDYLTFESTSNNNTISLATNGIHKIVSASTDNGETWTEYEASDIESGTTIATLNAGDKVLLKGENSTYAVSMATYDKRFNYFRSTGQFNAYGNMMSLISGDSFENADTLTASFTFAGLFSGCTGLISAENLILPATTLAKHCYREMFRYCTSLTTAPELPATTLAYQCYGNMFYGCTSLNYIKCLATDISAQYCTTNWVNGVANSGTFVKAASMSSWTTSVDGIPTGWTIQNDDGSPYIDDGGGDNGRVD